MVFFSSSSRLYYSHSSTEFYASRFKWVVAVFAVLWLMIGARLWQLQIVRGEHYEQVARNNYLRSVDIPAPRGNIYDRYRQLLVTNRAIHDLVLVPQFAHNVPETLQTLARVLHTPVHMLKRQYEQRQQGPKFRPITLKKNLTLHEVSLVHAIKSYLPGIDVQDHVRRDYRYHPPPHLVGYLGPLSQAEYQRLKEDAQHSYEAHDLVGKYGLEQRWESYLRGKAGRRILTVDAHGRAILGSKYSIPTSVMPAVPGHDLHLTIDRELQQIAQRAFAGKSGAVVVMDARSGALLAMVSAPSYPVDMYQSPISHQRWKKLVKDPMRPLFDKTTGAQFQPGSTFKVILALAGLQEAVLSEDVSVNCSGSWTMGGRTFHCHKREGHGAVNLRKALVQSCNVFFYQLGQELGVRRIGEYAKLFRLGQSLGLGLNMERSGLVPSPSWKQRTFGKPWFLGETYLLAVGQGPVLITPLQLVSLYAAIGRGGDIWQPYLVQSVAKGGEEVMRHDPKLLQSVHSISSQHYEAVRESLKDVVELGTARRARVAGVSVAGKTGSVQVVSMKRDQDQEALFSSREVRREKREHALFAAFSPADHAEVAIAVISEHDTYGSGGAQAAPIAQKILAGYWQLKRERQRLMAERALMQAGAYAGGGGLP